MTHLVREYLTFFGLDCTLSVFDPEVMDSLATVGTDSSAGAKTLVGGTDARPMRDRSQLIEGLGLSELTNKQTPLLAEIVKLSKVAVLKSETPTPTERSGSDPFKSLHSIYRSICVHLWQLEQDYLD